MIISWPDARVASDLCKWLPIHYQFIVDGGISEDWILTFVVPSIASKYWQSVSLVLGRALLRRIFYEVQHFAVPDSIFRRVKNSCQGLGYRCRLPEGESPVVKFPMIFTVSYMEVRIDVLLENGDMEDGGNTNGGGCACLSRPLLVDSEQLRHVNTLLVSLRQDGSDLRS